MLVCSTTCFGRLETDSILAPSIAGGGTAPKTDSIGPGQRRVGVACAGYLNPGDIFGGVELLFQLLRDGPRHGFGAVLCWISFASSKEHGESQITQLGFGGVSALTCSNDRPMTREQRP